jgi:biopolymer transport protein TolR
MTRRQVRAAMRRLKAEHDESEEETGEINLVPYMDIVTNIIIFLLASVVQQVPLGNINVSSPTIGVGGEPSEAPEKPPLNLTVTLAANGFIVAGSGAVTPPIPKLPNGKYDFDGLTNKLLEIKKDPALGAQNETKATFNADSYIPYELVIQTLDAMREDKAGKALFPDIVFAAGIL